MVFRTCRVGIVENHGQSVAWTLAELHVALYDGLENEFLEVSFHFVVYLIGQSETTVVHSQQKSFNLERWVQLALDYLDGVEQLGDTLKCEVFALHGYDDRVGSCERIYGNQSERGAAVDEYVVVLVAYLIEHILDNALTVFEVEHLNLSSHKVNVAWNDVKSVDVSGVYSIAHVCMVDYALIQ